MDMTSPLELCNREWDHVWEVRVLVSMVSGIMVWPCMEKKDLLSLLLLAGVVSMHVYPYVHVPMQTNVGRYK